MVADSPTAPWANTATESPRRRWQCSAPMKPVESMSQAYTAASLLTASGIGARLAIACGTMKYSAMLPSRWAVYW